MVEGEIVIYFGAREAWTNECTFITFRVHLFFVRCSRGEHERPAQMQAIVLDEAWPAMAFGWPMVSLEEESEGSREREAGGGYGHRCVLCWIRIRRIRVAIRLATDPTVD